MNLIENVTMGDVVATVTVLAGFFGGLGYLHKGLKDWLAKLMAEQTEKINKDIAQINSRLDMVDMQACKNFLVRCIADFENGDKLSETELERFWEQYSYYIQKGGNTYIKHKVERLQEKGILE